MKKVLLTLTRAWDSARGLLSGYDIFISYTRADARDYAAKLYEHLTSLDYSCFFDKEEAPGGRPLNSSLLSALRRSRTLVLIGTPRALERDYVKLEFQEFVRTGRPIIPVSVGGALHADGVLSSSPWSVIKERDLIWLDETSRAVAEGTPAPEIYKGIQSYFKFTRRNVTRRRVASGAALFIVAAALVAVWQGAVAAQRLGRINEEVRKARELRDSYEQQVGGLRTQLGEVNTALGDTRGLLTSAQGDLEATKTALGLAEEETRKADGRREAAEANARKAEERERLANLAADRAERRAKANAVVLTADAAPDPLTSLLLLTELPRDEEPADGMRVARRLAHTLVANSVMRGHAARLTSVAFSPDGERVLTASADGTVRVWAADGRGDPAVLRGHADEVTKAVFGPDGLSVATASKDGTARLWRPGGQADPLTFRHGRPVTDAQLTADGLWLATTAEGGEAKLWALAGGADVPLSLPGGRPVMRLWLAEDGTRGLAAADDCTVWRFAVAEGRAAVEPAATMPEDIRAECPSRWLDKIYFSRDGSHVAFFHDKLAIVQNLGRDGRAFLLRHDGLVNSVAFDKDAARAVTASSDGKVRVWRTSDGKAVTTLDPGIRFFMLDLYRDPSEPAAESSLSVKWASFTHDGKRILTYTEDGVLRLWDAGGGAQPAELRGHIGADIAAFNRDDNRLVTGSGDGTARVWPLSAVTEPAVLRHQKPVNTSTPSRDGSLIVTGSSDGVARVWRSDGPSEPLLFDARAGSVSGASFDRSGRSILTAHADGVARLWSLDGRQRPRAEFGERGAALVGAELSPDETRVLTWSDGGDVKVFRRDNSAPPYVVGGPRVRVWWAQFSPDGSHVAAAYDDGTARVCEADGSSLCVLLGGAQGHKASVRVATFSPDGRRVLTVSKDGTARVWRADGAGAPVVLTADPTGKDGLEWGTFSPDGTRLLTTSAEGRALVWNAEGRGKPVALRRRFDLAHVGSISRAIFSPDGSRIVTAGEVDGVTCVWKAEGGDRPIVLQGHVGSVLDAKFSADGSRVVTASEDGTARVWRTSWGELLAHLRRLTTATLTPEDRLILLRESEPDALRNYERDERLYGRSPLPAASDFK